MARDTTARRPPVADDKHPTDGSWRPADLSRDFTSETSLAVQDEQGRLDVGHDRLDLDHDDGAGGG
jgi:hypothetical protein